MKILKKGRVQKGWAIEQTCSGAGNGLKKGGMTGCGATLLVEQPDVFVTETHHRDETDRYHTFRCPDCGVETDLPDEVIPNGSICFPSKREWIALQEFKNDLDGRIAKLADATLVKIEKTYLQEGTTNPEDFIRLVKPDLIEALMKANGLT